MDDPWSAGDDVCETSDMAHTPVLATEASRLLSDGSADRFRFASGSIDQVSYKKSGPVSQVPESLVYNKLSGQSRNMRVHAMSTTGHSRRGENRKPPLQATKVRDILERMRWKCMQGSVRGEEYASEGNVCVMMKLMNRWDHAARVCVICIVHLLSCSSVCISRTYAAALPKWGPTTTLPALPEPLHCLVHQPIVREAKAPSIVPVGP